MPRWNFRQLSAVLVVLGASLATAMEPVPMNYNPPAGARTRVVTHNSVKTTGGPMPLEMETSMTLDYQVQAQDQRGWRLAVLIADASLSMPAVPGMPAGLFETMLDNIKGQTMTCRITTDGNIVLEQMNLPEHLQGLVQTMDLEGTLANSIMTGIYQPDSVSVGDVWSASQVHNHESMRGIASEMIQTITYEVIAFRDFQGRRIPELAVTLSMNLHGGGRAKGMDNDVKLQMTGQGSGKLLFDPVLALPVKARTSMTIEQSIPAPMGGSQTFKQEITSSSRLAGQVLQSDTTSGQ